MTTASCGTEGARPLLIAAWSFVLFLCLSYVAHGQLSAGIPVVESVDAPHGEEPVDPFTPVPISSYHLMEGELFGAGEDTAGRVERHGDLLLIDAGTCQTDIAVRRGEGWIYFSAPLDARSIEHELLDLDGEGEDELVLRGACGAYGSGGGTSEHAIAIYRIDSSVVQLFEAVDGFTEEAFARPYNRRQEVLGECRRVITLSSGELRISAIARAGRRSDACGYLTPLREGVYRIHDGAFVRAAGTR